eukprot:TRINITY_DN61442_c0_g1_i1.p1 TRINITY_DN61442_c0_g1~~TRINITY_DN61442_c0_g1_i1.p1  ORF type:complete len:501 (+),score=92.41 TRINITY_DN61442_c0_g1_i1:125-1504(+)
MAPSNPVDLAQRLVAQQRHQADRGIVSAGGGNDYKKVNEMAGMNVNLAAVSPAIAGMADAKVSQLAERTSLLLAKLQGQAELDKQDIENQLEQVSFRVESRLKALDARLDVCEEQAAARERREGEAMAVDGSRVLKEARALVGGAVSEMQAQWRSHRSEFRGEQEDHARRIRGIEECAKQDATKLQDVLQAVQDQASSLRQAEEQIHGLLSTQEPPPWFRQVEESVASLERRLEERWVAVEMRLQQHRVDMDGFRLRCDNIDGMRDEILSLTDQRFEQEAEERLKVQKWSDPVSGANDLTSSANAKVVSQDFTRRLEEVESRQAALRVRVDSHDSRFSSLGERAEAACQQAVESSRQVAAQQRDEILSEADCQMRILRQRVEALSELCDELSLREVARSAHRNSSTGPTTVAGRAVAAGHRAAAERAASPSSERSDAERVGASGIANSGWSSRPPALPY